MTYVNGGSVLAVAVLFIALGIAAVIARLSVRRRKSGLGIDDWLCLLALVSSSVPAKGHSKANELLDPRHRRRQHHDHR